MIRDALGEEAIIVATNEDRNKGGVRVTAAVEPSFEIGDDGIASGNSWLQYDEEQDGDAVAEELTDILLRHCVPEDVMDHMISCATVMGFDDIQTAIFATIEQLFAFHPLPTKTYRKPIIMVGPPGSGKTLAAAKMAARGTMNGLNVGVISTDTVRAGGVEQLEAFTNLLKIKLQKTGSPKELAMVSQKLLQSKDQVIVDTSGLNPFNTDDVKMLAKLLSAVDARPVLVLPAGIDADEAGEMARVFATIGVTNILPTRVDMARRLGSLLSAAYHGNLSFCDLSNTPKVAQGLAPMNPTSLSKLLMPRLYQSEKSGIMNHKSPRTGVQKTGTKQ